MNFRNLVTKLLTEAPATLDTDRAGKTTKQTTLTRVDWGSFAETEEFASFKEHLESKAS